MSTLADDLQFPAGSLLLARWQAGDDAAGERLRALFDAVMEGQFDAVFSEPAPADSVCVTTSLHLLTLTILNALYGLTSADFYKGDPQRYVRTTLLTQRLLGIRKLTLGWPVYAFGAECLGQAMMYPDKHAPGADLGEPLVDRTNWRELDTPAFESGVPRVIEEMLACFADLTGLEPVAHLPAPYSLAADILGQEALLSALLEAPDFVDEFLDHLTDRVFVPWIERLIRRFPKRRPELDEGPDEGLVEGAWIELSDASGSPLFISPRLCMKVAARPVRRLIDEHAWGKRVFVANYRGDHLVQPAGGGPRKGGGRRRAAGRRGRRGEKGGTEAGGTKSSADAVAELIDFKLGVCPEFIIKLEADEAPVSFYVEQAIQRGKPLYLGIGATRIDRNSVLDREAAERDLEDIAAEYAHAIKTVSEALAHDGHPRSDLAWPGDVYIEDINAESDLGLVKTIVEAVTIHGR
ncbi:MAG: hypothetical protein MAG451_02147 [Anaerolineales bacterium]|nr:hypothetical protein [Anaerolineales bacterium]